MLPSNDQHVVKLHSPSSFLPNSFSSSPSFSFPTPLSSPGYISHHISFDQQVVKLQDTSTIPTSYLFTSYSTSTPLPTSTPFNFYSAASAPSLLLPPVAPSLPFNFGSLDSIVSVSPPAFISGPAESITVDPTLLYDDEVPEVYEMSESNAEPLQVLTAYKRVDQKVRPVPGIFPENIKVRRIIPEDPLLSMLPLSVNPPDFVPTTKLTAERMNEMKIPDGFLWPEEVKLFMHVMALNERSLAFHQSERGTFREDYFSPYIYPVVDHVPWVQRNIPIPPGIRDKVITLLREKIDAGVYEPSQASYRSKWFCVLKKNGSLRIVHDLQPLNAVSIRDAGIPPVLDDFVEPFAGRSIYTVFDLYWGYDARKVDPSSRDLTTFQSPIGPLRITSMPMGYTNSVSEFQACTTFVLQDEIPSVTNVFIDDIPIKGPVSRYEDENGNPETIPGNPGIRRFVWEHANDVHRIMHRLGCSGVTFSATKTQLAKPEVIILGQKCTREGRLPEEAKIKKILDWPILKSPTEVRGFLGLCGTVRIWIKGYSGHIRPLTELYRKHFEFIWDDRRQEAFDTLKTLVTQSPALRSIDYASILPVILAVDTSYIAIGIILLQIDEEGRRRPARYGSIPINERESRYSQPKLELFGLFRALRHYRLYLIGVKNLHVEVDAKYIKGMLNEPDLQPNASMNRWIQGILLFDFKLVHVKAENHKGPDALSRRIPTAEELQEEQETDDWLDDIALLSFSTHQPLFQQLQSYALFNQSPSIFSFISTQDKVLYQIFHFLHDLKVPEFSSTQARLRFLKRTTEYYLNNGEMYRRRLGQTPLLVILDPEKRRQLLTQAHEELGHRGVYGVFGALRLRFFWPYLFADIKHHVSSCHPCQIRSTRKTEVPITISSPSTIFTKIYVDVMYMPKAGKFRYIVLARDDLSRAPEGRALRSLKAREMANFFWEEVICRYGAIGEVVTDNGSEVSAAFTNLLERYGIPHIRISPYNSKANGVVERGHIDIRESLVKACGDRIQDWHNLLHHALFADKCITRRSTGRSPFYLLYGVEPVLPFDLTEATFMVDGFRKGMSSEDLLALRIRQLAKRESDLEQAAEVLHQSRLRSKEEFERRYARRIRKTIFQPGDLVLIRNTRIEKELNRKTKARYLGPYEVVRQTKAGSYVVRELDGSTRSQGVAAFRMLPYYPRDGSVIPRAELDEVISSLKPEHDEDSEQEDDFFQDD
jgi:transposase InsO family protein